MSLTPKQASDEQFYKPILAEKLNIPEERILLINVRRKSVDARQRAIRINLGVEVFIDELPSEEKIRFTYDLVGHKPSVIIIGAGPAGLFAALRLIELGFKPIIFERGKNVSDRKRDIAKIHRDHLVDPDSNYGFGEGGAGTFWMESYIHDRKSVEISGKYWKFSMQTVLFLKSFLMRIRTSAPTCCRESLPVSGIKSWKLAEKFISTAGWRI